MPKRKKPRKQEPIHLSQRAIEFLQEPVGPADYRTRIGERACSASFMHSLKSQQREADKATNGDVIMVSVNDVRAIKMGWKFAKGSKGSRPIRRPTCGRCMVELDRALESSPPVPTWFEIWLAYQLARKLLRDSWTEQRWFSPKLESELLPEPNASLSLVEKMNMTKEEERDLAKYIMSIRSHSPLKPLSPFFDWSLIT